MPSVISPSENSDKDDEDRADNNNGRTKNMQKSTFFNGMKKTDLLISDKNDKDIVDIFTTNNEEKKSCIIGSDSFEQDAASSSQKNIQQSRGEKKSNMEIERPEVKSRKRLAEKNYTINAMFINQRAINGKIINGVSEKTIKGIKRLAMTPSSNRLESPRIKREVIPKDEPNMANENHLEENYDDLQPVRKKIKTIEDGKKLKITKFKRKKSSELHQRCSICRQKENDIKLYPGHPNGATEESVSLTDSRFSLFTGDENAINESDQRPQNKLTHFSVYDKNGHLCAFDTGLIEKNIFLYFSGYMKAIYVDDPSPEDAVPTKDMGPINEWWVSGFDGGEFALIGFNTPYGEYILMEPSEAYAPFMIPIREKIHMSKMVVEFLLDEINPTYEDLVNKLQMAIPLKGLPRFTEESLLKHSQFICDQILSFDASANPEDPLLITNPCMRTLIKFAGTDVSKRLSSRRNGRINRKVKKPLWTKATTTLLVNDMFEHFFSEQLAEDGTKESLGPKRRRCGVCETCQQPDCGACSACKDKTKFGGMGKSKQACTKRRCPNMALQEADDSDPDDEDEYQAMAENIGLKNRDNIQDSLRYFNKKVVWQSDVIIEEAEKKFYSKALVGDELIELNDSVLVAQSNPTIPLQIAKIIYMWQNKRGEKLCHMNYFLRGSDSILGETSDDMELFLIDRCCVGSLMAISSKCTVIRHEIPHNWAELGNTEFSMENAVKEQDGKTFYYQKRYCAENARFEDPLPERQCPANKSSHKFCQACERCAELQTIKIPMLYEREEERSKQEIEYGLATYKGIDYRVGDAIYLYPGSLKFKYNSTFIEPPKIKKEGVDDKIYPEYYRKSSDRVRGSNYDTPEPFNIGYINSIYATTRANLVPPENIFLKVNKMYRPENTHKGGSLVHQVDLNLLYWSDEVCKVEISNVAGKCYLAYGENLDVSIDDWTSMGPHRFYFGQSYNVTEMTFDEPPPRAMAIGRIGKGKGTTKGKGKIKGKINEEKGTKRLANVPIDDPPVVRKLQTLDVFAGCGGLSEGLHQAGVTETLWAIEKDEPAAWAYSLNNKKTAIFAEDCNVLLKKVINGEKTDENGQCLPLKGEVELMCGGPPCQGFSGMNRFKTRQYSLFKNSLLASLMSYCDYYRPKFFIMENVRNFVFFKRNMVLKLTLRCLLKMGYQCTFGILQAGNYGVPQTRRRLIIFAAAPGQVLPKYPEPTHVFSKRGTQLSCAVDNKKYNSNIEWVDSAPYRTINVKDAMSDLPNIRNGCNIEEMPYGGEAVSQFQRKIRGNQTLLRDHVCKEMTPLIEARMSYIPTACGADWRDLPNIVVTLSDGTTTKKLEYIHDDKKSGKSSTGAYRGVCACCTGKPCDPLDRQFNTLIPWCLPHTANRHNNWAGLYGRLEWDGYFSTTITNPEPMGKQGRVLHPDQIRVVSVRECARSQGFPDSYRFYGTIFDKHRQVGNAVPPPLAQAIGREIRLALAGNINDIKPPKKEIEESSECSNFEIATSSSTNEWKQKMTYSRL